jgi:hypothetical protein
MDHTEDRFLLEDLNTQRYILTLYSFWIVVPDALSSMSMMILFIIFIGILPPYMEIFKVFEPHLGMTFKILRLMIRRLLNAFAIDSRLRATLKYRFAADQPRPSMFDHLPAMESRCSLSPTSSTYQSPRGCTLCLVLLSCALHPSSLIPCPSS